MRRVTTLALAVVFALAVGGCTEAAATPQPSEPAIETLTPVETPEEFPTEPPLEEPIETPEESFPTEPPLEEPFPSEEPVPSEEPLPTEPMVTPVPGTAIPATECSDNPDEQEFYATVVTAAGWDVYCPALPTGWHLERGSYRLAGDGFFEISYEDRSGSRLELSEGAFCDAADGCVPPGSDAGAASFGDMAGTLVAGSDGSWAVVVDRGAQISWLLVGRSIDEATFRALAAGLTRVAP